MASTIELIKELRELTGSGLMDCKKALAECDNDIEKSVEWLRKKGIASAEKKSSRTAAEGLVCSYIHGGGTVGVLLEVNIETDFAAKNEDFQEMCRNIAMQIAAMNPSWVRRDEVPAEIIEREKDIVSTQAKNEGKPEKIIEKIVAGRLEKFYAENCLMEQAYIRDEDKTIDQLVKEMIAYIGENIQVRRFTRYELGEGIEKKEECFLDEVQKQLNG
ncbi:MAG: translation elongation factor Ts [Eubacteriales bacterium]|nr:translation elongation factor Ts [Eubacteriales bacterium]